MDFYCYFSITSIFETQTIERQQFPLKFMLMIDRPPKKKFHNQSDISVLYSNEGVHFIVEMNSGNGYLSELK